MNEEEKEAVYNILINVSDLLYVLEAALDNEMQISRDTKPYAAFANLIRHKVADASEIVQ